MAVLNLLLAALLPTALASTTGALVYLHPPPSSEYSRAALSPSQAHAVLSYHLGIDRWVELKHSGQWIDELVRSGEDGSVISAGEGGVVVLVESDTPEDILPYAVPAFTIPFPLPYSTYSTLLNTYSSRMASLISPSPAFVDSYNASSYTSSPLLSALDMADSPAAQQVEQGLQKMLAYADWVDQGGATGAAVEVRGLGELKETNAEAYDEGVRVLEAALSVPALTNHNYALIVLPTSASTQSSLLTQSTAAANTSSCYTTSQACDSATSACSGHGHCAATIKAGKTCYVCSCSKALALAGQTTNWAGAKCEKIDISGSFTLLIGSTVFMIAIAVGSVMLLYGVGNQELPSTLFGAAPGTKRE
ncbi:hypothetical protein CALVIDRAFT_564689 [Calocera viscosa TUFC12733]|uniref:Vacuolar sorting protein Vps3844 C-terminal domain-containing protein n=1 Tax=Calocera viscosa (strain TUFC12733) TaxID=1330018 RepID=A0A167LG00_CALVF|nr:hypothetical protein CALVIDRAFT_564689 [Calocera viscosa TUFC12733]